ncbi:MAG: peptidoglycan-binding protein [Clostridia bacterium]|nr:peptidoglycan-binding protein [Clostridia bacterium]MBP3652839.1 peptidoglycan-binding protein [Clostridia bacterium]
MDTEIAGKTGIAITSDTTSTLYKRYPYNADQGHMTYMVVNTYNDGVEGTYLFEIQAPVAEAPAAATEAEAGTSSSVSDDTALTVGTKGDAVKRLQAALIDKGLLSGQPDGHYGNYTAAAVKEMQRRFGMEQTGVADKAFLDKLYS